MSVTFFSCAHFSSALGLYFLKAVGAISITHQFRFVECMLLGTILAAVDPVAVSWSLPFFFLTRYESDYCVEDTLAISHFNQNDKQDLEESSSGPNEQKHSRLLIAVDFVYIFSASAKFFFFFFAHFSGLHKRMEPVWIFRSSHKFAIQSSHSVDLAGWQAKMASIEFWIPWCNAHRPWPHCKSEMCVSKNLLLCPIVQYLVGLFYFGFRCRGRCPIRFSIWSCFVQAMDVVG